MYMNRESTGALAGVFGVVRAGAVNRGRSLEGGAAVCSYEKGPSSADVGS